MEGLTHIFGGIRFVDVTHYVNLMTSEFNLCTISKLSDFFRIIFQYYNYSQAVR